MDEPFAWLQQIALRIDIMLIWSDIAPPDGKVGAARSSRNWNEVYLDEMLRSVRDQPIAQVDELVSEYTEARFLFPTSLLVRAGLEPVRSMTLLDLYTAESGLLPEVRQHARSVCERINGLVRHPKNLSKN